MYKKSINKITAMVKMSEALDQTGYVDESAIMLYNAFELAEDTAWRMAGELNSMVKTASKSDQNIKLAELENMTKIALSLGWLESLLNKGAGAAGNLAANKALSGATTGIKGLLNRGLTKTQNVLGGAAENAAQGGKLWNRGTQAIEQKMNPERLAIEQQLAGKENLLRQLEATGGNTDVVKQQMQALEQQMAQTGEHTAGQAATQAGLTDLGKLGLGTVGLGAGALALHGMGSGGAAPGAPTAPGQIPIAGAGPAIPEAGAAGGAAAPAGTTGGGMAGGAAASGMSGATAEMGQIENRLNTLEGLVNQIRAKVGI